MKNPAISIIVPVYNVGVYLRPCLESILSQSFKDFEVLLIEGFSTDESKDIVQEYAEKYSNFYLLKPEKAGVAYSRNMGIEQSKGEYIAFVDSDDMITKDYLEKLYKAAMDNDADVACCNYALHYPEKKYIRKILLRKTPTGVHTGEKVSTWAICDKRTRNYLWNKMWRKSLFMDNNIRFPLIMFEDVATVPRLLYYAKKVVVIKDCMYYYTKRRGSIMTSVNERKISDYIYAVGVIRNFFEEIGIMDKKLFLMQRFTLWVRIANWYNIAELHIKSKSFKGFLRNIHASGKALSYYKSKKFKPSKGFPERICKITAPD